MMNRLFDERVYSAFFLFGGLGGGPVGMQASRSEFRGVQARFTVIGSVDCDPLANDDFEMFTGVPATQVDLFSREDYIAFHGSEPPAEWREATPEDILKAAGRMCPDVIFLSAPCKGFSGLLPTKSAQSEKYQALNRLTVRGMKLTLEAFKDNLPSFIIFENVPRITTRGENLLKAIKKMLKKVGYEFHEGYHDCGVIGGLGQHRRRYLLVARNTAKVSNYLYQPPELRVKSIGEVIGPLPMPDDPAGGPMHRMPNLEWKTAVRLALIDAGADWRCLENIPYEKYGIVPMPLEYFKHSYKVHDFNQAAGTITGACSPSNGAICVADPRLSHSPREGFMKIQDWELPSTTIVGSASATSLNGAACISDPRLNQRGNRHPSVYKVVRFDEPAPCVTGTRFGSGAPAIADPRTNFKPGTHKMIYRVQDFNEPARTITGALRPNNGAPSIADPRLGCSCRNGSYGVMDWDKPGVTVTGSGDIHSGCTAVADPRIPADNERGVWIIIALDGTWHRPLTTWELLALQGFPLYMPDGSAVVLAGNSDARWRERIGNAVPPPAAMAIGDQILRTLLLNEFGEWELTATPIWVKKEVQDKVIYSERNSLIA